ncbi:MAG TPA: 2OG-Fe(II) oxygenase [Agitococcus sp.]|nr:2OG-Fe(II) oxygenase [Agitococcus sp.]
MQSSQNQQFNNSVFNPNQAFDALATDHYAVIPQFLTSTMREALLAELLQLQAQGLFHEASVGRGVGQTRQAHIRGDSICWLEDHFTIGGQYLALMEQLRQQLNADFYLGLRSYEAHYAHYQAGSVYQRHVDRHRDNNARVVTTVCYLNDDWPTEAGGQLKLYNPNHELLLEQTPTGSSLVLFRSADMPHEVLAANRSRFSIAGWFRQD